MRTIIFTNAELEHLRSFYADELKQATRYVEQVQLLIAKFGKQEKPKVIKPILDKKAEKPASEPLKNRERKPVIKGMSEEPDLTEPPKGKGRKAIQPEKDVVPVVETAKKRGRKPSVKAEPMAPVVIKPVAKVKRSFAKKATVSKQDIPEIPFLVPTEKISANAQQEKPTAPMEPKPKRKRIHNKDHRGKVLLAGWNQHFTKKQAKPKGKPGKGTSEPA